MSTAHVVAGFSLTNRLLLYTSMMLVPAQFISGLGSNFPTNLGFLAYNWYTQLDWYWSTRGHRLHALCLLAPHFNLIYAITYLGGVTSGNIWMGLVLGFGTGGVMLLNTVSAWVSWAADQPEGYGVYQFFFFGWRTLDPDWHTFLLCWQIFDSITALTSVVLAIGIAIGAVEQDYEEIVPWYLKYPAIPVGAAAVLLGIWPLIMWTELIVARNNIESPTDWIAVWLFAAQAGTMLIPSWSGCLGK